jgi:hypothetical protein
MITRMNVDGLQPGDLVIDTWTSGRLRVVLGADGERNILWMQEGRMWREVATPDTLGRVFCVISRGEPAE